MFNFSSTSKLPLCIQTSRSFNTKYETNESVHKSNINTLKLNKKFNKQATESTFIVRGIMQISKGLRSILALLDSNRNYSTEKNKESVDSCDKMSEF